MGFDLTGFGSAFDFAGEVLKRVLPEKVSEKDKLETQFQVAELLKRREDAVMEAQKQIIVAEIQGESWLQRNWRPVLMMTIVVIIANNFILFPYLSMFTTKAALLELPEQLYNLMTLGVGGYVAGRSVEKGIKEWKKK